MSPRVILVTGTSRGVGAALRAHLIARGHVVYGSSRAPRGGDPFELELDVTERASCTRAVQTVLEREGRIDALVNNAGSHLVGAAAETSEDELRAQLELNFFGAVAMIEAVLPAMIEARRGNILNLSSVGGRFAMPFTAAYSASKFALEGYTEALRLELLPLRVFVTNLEPGYLKTGTTDRSLFQVKGGGTVYEEPRASAWARMQQEAQGGTDLARVGRVVERILESRHPKFRYSIDGLVPRLHALRALLPTAVFEGIVLSLQAPELRPSLAVGGGEATR
jgi:NAD(P)-dependent dehydrogenase (short-subunit alcohol dehydrogenase family)